MNPYLAEMLLAERAASLRREACSARLVALVRRCQPSTWARPARWLTAAFQHR